MSQTLQASPELVAQSADYFAANPDVDFLVAVVSKGEFYRPEREDLAKHEAMVYGTQAVRVHRRQLTPAGLADAAPEMPEYPAVVGTVELLLASVKLDGVSARQLAELIYGAALQQELTPAAAEAMMEAVADWLGTALANGLDSITLQNDGVLATLVAEAGGAVAADQTADGTGQAGDGAGQAGDGAGQAGDGADAGGPADDKKDDGQAGDSSAAADAPAAKPAKAKAAPKKKASTDASAA